MAIQYISWNYGRDRNGNLLHLIRYKDGSGKLFTSSEMIQMGLAKGK